MKQTSAKSFWENGHEPKRLYSPEELSNDLGVLKLDVDGHLVKIPLAANQPKIPFVNYIKFVSVTLPRSNPSLMIDKNIGNEAWKHLTNHVFRGFPIMKAKYLRQVFSGFTYNMTTLMFNL